MVLDSNIGSIQKQISIESTIETGKQLTPSINEASVSRRSTVAETRRRRDPLSPPSCSRKKQAASAYGLRYILRRSSVELFAREATSDKNGERRFRPHVTVHAKARIH
jgi:hypothetical protein